MVKSIVIYASEISACIGRNKYKSPHDALLQVWSRVSPETYALYGPKNDIIQKMTTASQEIMNANPETTDEIASLVQKLKELEPCPNAVQCVKSALYTKFGTANEDIVTQKVSSELGMEIRKTDKFVKKFVFSCNGIKVYIGGRLDGMAGEDCVIEIKNRMNRLFNHVCEYEKLQISAYMHIMGVSRGILAERHNENVVLHEVQFDNTEWSDAVRCLEIFSSDLVRLINDEDEMRNFACLIPDS